MMRSILAPADGWNLLKRTSGRSASFLRMRDPYKILVDGWNLKNYVRNPVVLFAHNAAMLPVGRAKSVYREGGLLVAEMQFSSDQFAQRTRRQVDEGVLTPLRLE
jgi:hypothetical protein